MNPTPERPLTANLDNPLYYLQNFRTVLDWVSARHADLLLPEERARLERFDALPRASQALLVRMVMRKGEMFRLGKLRYAEIGAVDKALAPLVEDGWIDPQPQLTLAELFALLTRAELATALRSQLDAAGLRQSATKGQMLEALAAVDFEPRKLAQWWPGSDDRVLALTGMPLFERIRLMFFGNLRQDWSEFVLAELGHQHYETVPLAPESRAFQARSEVDSYLHLHHCRERLDAGEPAAGVWADVPGQPDANPWLETRRGRLLFALGRAAERSGDPELALQAWARSGHPEARLKRLRLMERRGESEQAWLLLIEALSSPRNAAEQQGFERLRKRLGKRLNQAVPAAPRAPAIPTFERVLPKPDHGSVERAVAEHFATDAAPVHYVENGLFNGLLALLCWPAIYAPLPGAFFHPFHAAPADLYRSDFYQRRRELFEHCLASLETGDYRDRILDYRERKQGISSPFLYWPLLTRECVELALDCIAPLQLRACFERMLSDLREYRSGLPDLIQFWPDEQRCRLIEVKGPGDRLQDHQRRWLAFCIEQGIEVAVCHVQWQEAP